MNTRGQWVRVGAIPDKQRISVLVSKDKDPDLHAWWSAQPHGEGAEKVRQAIRNYIAANEPPAVATPPQPVAQVSVPHHPSVSVPAQATVTQSGPVSTAPIAPSPAPVQASDAAAPVAQPQHHEALSLLADLDAQFP